ncbi:MAG TPA: endolytic transglycosylase MltG, partial [Bacteroidia bacterium]|nr:endolytic transglycosylase MltG [Bacteroidia bacterium]
TVIFLLLVAAGMGSLIYKKIYAPNVMTSRQRPQFILIPTGSKFEDVVKILDAQQLLIDEKSFRWTAAQMKYVGKIRPGRYQLTPRMNNKELVSLLRSGKQVPVKVVFNNIRTREELAKKVGEQIEAKSSSILNLLNDPDYVHKLGFSSDNVLSLFLPNTYELYWNTSADQFINRMKKEYDKFWNAERITKARLMGLSTIQVSTLASIVQLETNKEDEKPVVAGVYYNRFKKDWKLEADPTLVYALGDFSINRVLSVYKEIDSPYNTYMYKGLPPGPICLPTTSSINAVLNYTKHNYMYFCAKDDFSGYHSFASTYDKHLLNARRFQKALDRRGIRS